MSWASYFNYTAHGQKDIPILVSTKQGKKMETTPKGIISETLVGHFKPLENIVEKTGSEDFKNSATNMISFHSPDKTLNRPVGKINPDYMPSGESIKRANKRNAYG